MCVCRKYTERDRNLVFNADNRRPTFFFALTLPFLATVTPIHLAPPLLAKGDESGHETKLVILFLRKTRRAAQWGPPRRLVSA